MNTAVPEAVVIGGSAGGFEALVLLLAGLPARPLPALLVVLHRAEEPPDLLADLLAQRCAAPVVEAQDKQPIKPGCVYVAPPRYHLMVERDRRCSLSQEDPIRYARPSIDVLFESAAEVYREQLLGILLSGANDDGARGMAAIRAAGGITWAQEPSSARIPTMPASAISADAASAVIDPRGMAAALALLSADRHRQGGPA